MEIGKKQRDPKKSLSRQVVDSIEEMIMERKLGPCLLYTSDAADD